MSSSNEAMNWQDGMGTIQDRMKHLLDTGEKSDVEFLVGKESLKEEPQLFKAHKFVLSISSSVFNAQFQYEEQMPINVIDVSASAFKAMLTFLYTNDLSMINCENYLDVYSAAKKYMLHAFVEKCHELAPKMLNYVNSVPIWRGAKLQEDKILIEHCLKFLDENIQDISFWYLNLNHTECGELLKRDSLQVDHELTLFEFLKDWAESQLENLGINDPTGEQLRAEIGPLIYDIRFPMITPTDFIKHIDERIIFNKKAAYIMAELLLRTTLFTDFGEDQKEEAEHTYLKEFMKLQGYISHKNKIDKKSLLPTFEHHNFFKFLSHKNDVKKAELQNVHYKVVKEEELDADSIFGFKKVLGINMERELNKLCADYKNTDEKNSNVYDGICKKIAKILKKQFYDAETSWRYHTKRWLKMPIKKRETLSEANKFVEELTNEYNKDENKANYYQQEKFDDPKFLYVFLELRKIITFGEARNLYRQIWIKALNFALMSIDIRYIPSRLKIWDEKERENVKKIADLKDYHEGMSDVEYLIYFLLKIIKQIHPKFSIYSEDFDEPFEAVKSDDVLLIYEDKNLPKKGEGQGGGPAGGGSGLSWLTDWRPSGMTAYVMGVNSNSGGGGGFDNPFS